MTDKELTKAAQDHLPKDVDALARKLEQHQQSLLSAVDRIKHEVAPAKLKETAALAASEGSVKETAEASKPSMVVLGASVLAVVVVAILIKRRKKR